MNWQDHKFTLMALGALVIAAFSTAVIVPETHQAVVIRAGEPTRVINKFDPAQPYGQTGAGLQWRIPVYERVQYVDRRVLDLDMERQQVLSNDQQRLQVDAYARYRIIDPVRMVERAGTEGQLNSQLAPILNSVLRQELGRRPFASLINAERGTAMENITRALDEQAREYGAQVIDVRIKRTELPQQNLAQTFARMQAERAREAADERARGQEAAQRVRAQADRTAVELVSEAQRDAEIVRGEADAQRNAIFAQAFGRDPEFFAFYRSLSAYERALQGGNSTLVISPDSEFFDYLKSDTIDAQIQ